MKKGILLIVVLVALLAVSCASEAEAVDYSDAEKGAQWTRCYGSNVTLDCLYNNAGQGYNNW